MMFGLCVFTITLVTLTAAQPCPNACVCFRRSNTVRCMFSNLRTIPTVPDTTIVLDLRFNKISSIPAGSFSNLANLRTLLLNNNELQAIGADSFQGLRELRSLYLYKNRISRIDERAFRSLGELRQLFLHSNSLSSLPSGLFDRTNKLERIRFDANPLRCDCDLIWLTDYLLTKNTLSQSSATCSHPTRVQGRSIVSLDSAQFRCTPPRFAQQPNEAEARPGENAYFTCRTEGSPRPEISWFHNGQDVDLGDERIDILDDGTLIIREARADDSGVYECVARNSAGSIRSTKVRLRFLGNPSTLRFIRRPSNTTVVEGATVQLVCAAEGRPEPDTHWTRNGNRLAHNARYSLTESGTLYIASVRYADRGLYRCTVTNNVQTISTVARLTVNTTPTISGSSSEIRGRTGTSVDLTCVANGFPQPTTTWTKDGAILSSGGRYYISEGGQVLRISSPVESDRGLYVCLARNSVGTVDHTIRLEIDSHVAPTFSQPQPDKHVTPGSPIELDCHADADPAPEYRWLHDGFELTSGERVIVSNNRITIAVARKSDEGVYECVARNAAGSARSSIAVWVQEESTYPGDRFVRTAYKQASRNVDRAINRTRDELFNRTRTHTVADLLQLVRYPSRSVVEIARAAEVFEETLQIVHEHVRAGNLYQTDGGNSTFQDLVSPAILNMLANMSGCLPHQRVIDCSDMCFYKKYRAIGGICNNLAHPTWGAANAEFRRLLPPRYENGFNTPKGWETDRLYNGHRLPSARLVSTTVLSSTQVTDDDHYTHMLMQWGQFIDHDMSLAPQSVSFARFSDGRFCNETCENRYPCFPIPVPQNDPRIRERRCLGLARTSATCRSGTTSVLFNTLTPRQQINDITSYIDASHIYGSSIEHSLNLRDLNNARGLLRVEPQSQSGKPLLPYDVEGISDCQVDPSRASTPCFLAGDLRANEHLGLSAMHTMWLREHNHIANELLQLNPAWDHNRLYQEARKIVGALIQHITYSHWLPEILGPTGMTMLGNYTGYDPNVDASISNAFATVAFRFGHGLVQPIIYRLNASFLPIPQGNLPLHGAFFSPDRLVDEGGIDPLLRGLFAVSSKKHVVSQVMNNDLTERLFTLANEIGQDLGALNIQRGRDHGLPGYNDFRQLCGKQRLTRFSEFAREIGDRRVANSLRSLYGHVDNIDPFVGAMLEPRVRGSRLGPTQLCIIVKQFKASRTGDRHWYENDGVFTRDQVMQIKQVTIAGIICANSDGIDRVQRNVFVKAERDGGYKSCRDIETLNLKLWTECCQDCGGRNGRTVRVSRGFQSDQPLPERYHSSKYSYKHEKSYFHTASSTSAKTRSKMTGDIHKRMAHMENTLAKTLAEITDLKQEVRALRERDKLLSKKKTCLHQHQTRSDGEMWSVDPCRSCQCLSGTVECETKSCPQPSCSNPSHVQGRCCPEC